MWLKKGFLHLDREYIMASEIQTIKKSVLIKCATYIEQSLIPVFQKENWEVFLLGKKKTDFCNVTAYDCKSDRDALQQVLSGVSRVLCKSIQ